MAEPCCGNRNPLLSSGIRRAPARSFHRCRPSQDGTGQVGWTGKPMSSTPTKPPARNAPITSVARSRSCGPVLHAVQHHGLERAQHAAGDEQRVLVLPEQARHVEQLLVEETGEQRRARPDRVAVPGRVLERELQAHPDGGRQRLPQAAGGWPGPPSPARTAARCCAGPPPRSTRAGRRSSCRPAPGTRRRRRRSPRTSRSPGSRPSNTWAAASTSSSRRSSRASRVRGRSTVALDVTPSPRWRPSAVRDRR